MRSSSEIRKQIEWLESRRPAKNPLGMLRRAIEENWAEPPAAKDLSKQKRSCERQKRQDAREDKRKAAAEEEKRKRSEIRDALLKRWQRRTKAQKRRHHETAIKQATSDFLRRQLRAHADLDQPPMAILEAMAVDLAIPIGDSTA